MTEEVNSIINQIKHEEDFFHKAKLIEYLQKQRKLSTKELSDKLEIKPAYLCHIARLNKLPEMVVDGYYSKLISVSHLFIIARLKDQQQMISLYENVLANNLTVLQTEELVRENLYSIKSEGEHLPKQKIDITKAQLKEKYKNASVKIIQTRIKAKVVIEVKGSLKVTSQALEGILNQLSK